MNLFTEPAEKDRRTENPIEQAVPVLDHKHWQGLFDAWLDIYHQQLSGLLRFSRSEQPLGEIYFIDGKVVWAGTREEKQSFGSYLRRLGQVDDASLKAAREVYEKSHGEKSFMAILVEDLGVIQSPVLGQCVLLHTRQAIEQLVYSLPEATITFVEGKVHVVDTYYFQPEEVLPMDQAKIFLKRMSERTESSDRWYRVNKYNLVLRSLVNLPSYLATAVITVEGEIVAAHFNDKSIDANLLGVFLIRMVECSQLLVESMRLGSVDTLMLECAEGSLLAKQVDAEQQYIVTLILSHGGRVGTAKHQLESLIPKLQSWISTRAGAESID